MTLLVRILLLLVLPAAVGAQIQSQCTYLTPAGTLRAAGPTDKALPFINQLQCVLDEVRDAVNDTLAAEVACATATVPASTRDLISLTTAAALAGNETIVPSLKDTSSPSLTEGPTVASATGTTIQIAVFNRDVAAAHSVTVCAQILRP